MENNPAASDDGDVIMHAEIDNFSSVKEVVQKLKENSENKTANQDVINIVFEPDDEVEVKSPTTSDLLPKELDIHMDINAKNGTEKITQLDNDKDNIAKMFEKNAKMQDFINLCLLKITSKETKELFISKLPFCKKLFDRVDEEYIISEEFNAFLEEKRALSENSSLRAITSFNDIYQHLKSELKNHDDGPSTSSENSSKHEVIIGKLEHALRKVEKVIKKLEEAEVNFDDEEDSSYMKMQRYRERAVKLHEKICKYQEEDVNANNILYNRLDFSDSTYPEFNHAINKKFKNNTIFPMYYNVEQLLKKVTKDKGINLSESAFKQEARECFKNLGNLLQKRRKLDLLNVHSSYLVSNDDPASQDEVLESKLKESSKEARSKIDEICQKYVKLQETGANPVLSSDSDDSK
ncbi:hypothetical protein AMK59_7941, partial [Oryctes borbonicus]